MEQGARRAEREEGLDLQVRAPTLETMVDQEIQLVEDEIQAHAAAIVIAPADSMRLVPVLKKAQDAGIPVINVDNRLSGEAMAAVGMKPPPFVGVDNEKGAFLVAKYAADHVHGPTQAAVLEGIRAANNAVLRKRGAERGLATNKAVRIVAEETANWNIEEAYARSKSIFRAHPGVGLIFCANDVMAFGVLKYLEESGRTNVVVVGFDALDEAKTAIRAHRMLATVDQQADVQGYLSIQAALRLVRGEPVPPETWADVKLVTLETLP
jgi:ribose transport system substrate-binding protein